MEGIRRKRRCQMDCQDHIFQIQIARGNSSKYDIHLQFCPKYQRDPMPPEHVYPVFNNDGKYYTSAFILGVDRKVLIKNDLQQVMDHQKQIRDSMQKHNQLIFPRPSSKHIMCSVCKEPYRNYYTHIYSQQHRERISISSYNPHLLELCQRYLPLWEGAEQRADEAEENQENTRRQQFAQMSHQEFQEQESSLLDVQRGENLDVLDEQDEEDEEPLFTVKPSEKHKKVPFRSFFNDTDSVHPKSAKRTRPEIRNKDQDQDYCHKKYVTNNNHVINVGRQIRQRDERRYQKARDKLKQQKNTLFTKQLRNMPIHEDDAFVVVKTIYISQLEQGQQPAEGGVTNVRDNGAVGDENGVKISKEDGGDVEVIQVDKKVKEGSVKDRHKDRKEVISIEKLQKMECFEKNEKANKPQRYEKSEKYEKNEKTMREKVSKNNFEKNENEQKNQDKHYQENTIKQDISSYSHRNMATASSTPSPQNPSSNLKINQDLPLRSYNPYAHNEVYKNMSQYRQTSRNGIKNPQDIYKNISGSYGYYNPYAYGYYEPGGYSQNQRNKSLDIYNKQKEKTKKGEKPFQYTPVPYHWPINPSYYVPAQTAPMASGKLPSLNGDLSNPSKITHEPANPIYPGEVNIPINLPMYMNYPPPMPAPRFSIVQHQYMGYQYPHYIGNRPSEPRKEVDSQIYQPKNNHHQSNKVAQPVPLEVHQMPSSIQTRRSTRNYMSSLYAGNSYPTIHQEKIAAKVQSNNPLQ